MYGVWTAAILMFSLSDAPHKNYRKLHCFAALALSHIEYLWFQEYGKSRWFIIIFQCKNKENHLREINFEKCSCLTNQDSRRQQLIILFLWWSFAYTISFKNCMLWDWVSNDLKPSKNQTKCTLNLNFLVVFESSSMRSQVVTMKKVSWHSIVHCL